MNTTIIIVLALILLFLIILNNISINVSNNTEQPNSIQGTCSQTLYGCCPDGVNSKINANGTNCPPYNPGPGYKL